MSEVLLAVAALTVSAVDAGSWEDQSRRWLDQTELLEPCAVAGAQGLPTVEVRVDAEGHVESGHVAADSTPPTAACVLDVVQSVQFDPPGAPAQLRYTWPAAADVRRRELRASPLTAPEAQDFLTASAGAFERCEAQRAARLVVSVDADGGVTAVRAPKGRPPPCLAAVLQDLEFPRGSAAVELSLSAPPRPGKAPAAPGAVGALSERDLRLAHAADLRGLALCFLTHRGAAGQQGRFEVQVLVSEGGRVLFARPLPTGGALAGTDVASCTAARVRGWLFPPAKKPTGTTLRWVAGSEPEHLEPTDGGAIFSLTAADALLPAVDPGQAERRLALASELQACRATSAPTAPDAALGLDWRPQPDGAVKDPRVVGSVGVPPQLEQCALDRLRAFRFAPQAALPYRAAASFAFTATAVVPTRRGPDGGLDKDEILAVLKSHEAEVRFCYERVLQDSPTLEGSVRVTWQIGPDGSPLPGVHGEREPALDAVASCIEERIARWRFPEPRGGGLVNVTFPWVFKVAAAH